MSQTRGRIVRRLAHDRTAMVGGAVVTLMLATMAAAPWLRLPDPTAVDTTHELAYSSLRHPLGTDMLGRDMLSRLVYGGRESIELALAATAAITVLGLALGICSGLIGGVVDAVIMRVVDVLQALPLLMVAMVLIVLLGRGTDKLVLAVALLGWPGYARVVRAAALAIREERFVDAARAMGAPRRRIMARHILPNLVGPATVLSSVDLGRIVLTLSALSFLGFGTRPPHPEWGAMLAEARNYFYFAPRLLVYPGVAISLFVLAVNLCGDGLRDAVDRRVGQP